jgi:hypothetical protein
MWSSWKLTEIIDFFLEITLALNSIYFHRQIFYTVILPCNNVNCLGNTYRMGWFLLSHLNKACLCVNKKKAINTITDFRHIEMNLNYFGVSYLCCTPVVGRVCTWAIATTAGTRDNLIWSTRLPLLLFILNVIEIDREKIFFFIHQLIRKHVRVVNFNQQHSIIIKNWVSEKLY